MRVTNSVVITKYDDGVVHYNLGASFVHEHECGIAPLADALDINGNNGQMQKFDPELCHVQEIPGTGKSLLVLYSCMPDWRKEKMDKCWEHFQADVNYDKVMNPLQNYAAWDASSLALYADTKDVDLLHKRLEETQVAFGFLPNGFLRHNSLTLIVKL